MRIIAGRHRGRKLLPPPSDGTRPITDRAKQSLFDILAPLLPDAVVYDCFAGTGSMGLECLSRGAAHATFLESHRPTAAILRENIDALNFEKESTVILIDFYQWFATAPPRPMKAHLVFLDPPYAHLKTHRELLRKAAIQIASHLAPDGLVIFRHHTEDALSLPPLTATDTRDYGTMRIEILKN